MSEVWKYPIGLIGRWQSSNTLVLQKGAQFLAVGVQGDMTMLWALVDPDSETELRTFWVIGTGVELPVDRAEHIGTFQEDGFVWHVFVEL